MLQASRLKPPRHDRISGIIPRACIAGVIIQGGRCSIALLHLATQVALGTLLGSQLSRSVYQRFAPEEQQSGTSSTPNYQTLQHINR